MGVKPRAGNTLGNHVPRGHSSPRSHRPGAMPSGIEYSGPLLHTCVGG